MRKILYIGLLSSCFLYSEDINATQNSWGVEFNPLRLFVYNNTAGEESLSGTLSYFDKKNSIEIAVPFLYYADKKYLFEGSNHRENWNLGLHYRKYFSPTLDGGYIGAFSQYTYLKGMNYNQQYLAVNKLGFGLELGFKLKNLFNSSFYWGGSIAIGGYLGKESEDFSSAGYFGLDSFDIDNRRKIIDIELLKIGYEF